MQTPGVIPGTTTMSQIGVVSTPPPSQTNPVVANAALNLSLDDNRYDDENSPRKSNQNTKRGVLPKQATQIMKSWLFQHIVVSFMSFIV